MKALIIEPEELLRAELVQLLGGQFEAQGAATGQEGYDLFRAALELGYPYGLIVLDMELGGVKGIEVVRGCRELEAEYELYGSSSSRIVFLSAQADPKLIAEGFREGCDAYLIKPLKIEELERQLQLFGMIKGTISPARALKA